MTEEDPLRSDLHRIRRLVISLLKPSVQFSRDEKVMMGRAIDAMTKDACELAELVNSHSSALDQITIPKV